MQRLDPPGGTHPIVPVPCLGPLERVAEKLLANADRGLDPATGCRDALDLGMLIRRDGLLPAGAVAMAGHTYGDDIGRRATQVAAALGSGTQRASLGCLSRTWTPLHGLSARSAGEFGRRRTASRACGSPRTGRKAALGGAQGRNARSAPVAGPWQPMRRSILSNEQQAQCGCDDPSARMLGVVLCDSPVRNTAYFVKSILTR